MYPVLQIARQNHFQSWNTILNWGIISQFNKQIDKQFDDIGAKHLKRNQIYKNANL